MRDTWGMDGGEGGGGVEEGERQGLLSALKVHYVCICV